MGKTGKLRVKRSQQQQQQRSQAQRRPQPPAQKEEAAARKPEKPLKRKNPFDMLSTDSTGDEDVAPMPSLKRQKQKPPLKTAPTNPAFATSGYKLQTETVVYGTMKGEYVLIETEEQGMAAMQFIRSNRVLVVDCEGSSLGRAGTLTLIQVAIPSKVAFVFDVLTADLKELFFEKCGLRKVLESKVYLKIFHDCRADSDALFHHANVRLSNVFDTQIANALVNKFVYKTTPIPASLNAVVKRYGHGAVHATKEAMHKAMNEDETFWDRRPIAKIALEYASTDVLILHDVYEKLCKLMNPKMRLECLANSGVYVARLRDSKTGLRDGVYEFNGAPLYGIPSLDAEVKVYVAKLQAEGKWMKHSDKDHDHDHEHEHEHEKDLNMEKKKEEEEEEVEVKEDKGVIIIN